MKSLVGAIAPATSANLGAGFDVFAVALDSYLDEVVVEINNYEKIKINIEGIGSKFIPTDPLRNSAGIVAKKMLKIYGKNLGVTINIKKGILPASGLGSSGASAAATALAVSEALELGLSKIELIKLAAEGERASAGVPHMDNVSAAIFGFFTLVKSTDPFEVIQLSLPKNLEFVIAIPEIRFNTKTSRSILPKSVDIEQMVKNVGNASSFIAGMYLGDIDLMGRSMTDYVVEPARSNLIPGLNVIKQEVLKAGASGISISGAGPSLISIIDSSKENSDKVTEAYKKGFRNEGIGCTVFCCKSGPGARTFKKNEL